MVGGGRGSPWRVGGRPPWLVAGDGYVGIGVRWEGMALGAVGQGVGDKTGIKAACLK